MYVIIFKQHGKLNCEQRVYGPFVDYMDAEEALTDGRVPCLYGQGGRTWPRGEEGERNGHRYIQGLSKPHKYDGRC
jgi:hypothetical protein